MVPGFERIVEERIRQAQRKGAFDRLEGSGAPLRLADDRHVPEDLRMAYKVLKNADCLPPEIELKKEIERTEDLLAGMTDTRQRYGAIKKLNWLVMRLNMLRSGGSVELDMPQQYADRVIERIAAGRSNG